MEGERRWKTEKMMEIKHIHTWVGCFNANLNVTFIFDTMMTWEGCFFVFLVLLHHLIYINAIFSVC